MRRWERKYSIHGENIGIIAKLTAQEVPISREMAIDGKQYIVIDVKCM